MDVALAFRGEPTSSVILRAHMGSNVNIIGLGFLKRFNTTMDFETRRLYIEKSKMFTVKDVDENRGFTLISRDARIVVSRVGPDSPASDAGLAAGDVLLRVDDVDLSAMRLFAVYSLIGKAEKPIWITVLRGDRRFSVIVNRARELTERESTGR